MPKLTFYLAVFALLVLLAGCAPIIPSSSQKGETMQAPDDPDSTNPTLSSAGTASPDGTPELPNDTSSGGGGSAGSPGSATNEQVDWQTYVDEKFGFTLDYPQAYIPVVNPEREPSDPAPIHQVSFQDGPGDVAMDQFNIEVFENGGLSLEDWLSAHAPEGSRIPTDIGNRSGFQITLSIEIAPNQFYYAADGSNVYKLTPLGPYGQEMVKSFKLP
jgi:hypothetical protein